MERRRRAAIAAITVIAALGPATASARPGIMTLRLEGAAAAFVAEPAASRFGVGGGFGLSWELAPVPYVGIEVRYGALFFSQGSEQDFGGYHAPGVGLRVHPIADLDAGDLWLGASADLVLTGGLARPGLSVGLGYELELAWFARVGPFVRFHWVWQPDDDALGPADATFVSFGISGAFLGEEAAPAAAPVDTDGDGLLDPDDACPTEPEDRDELEDADGCPDLDDDADRIVDAADACRLVPEDHDGWQDEDGCPDLDDDADEIPDASDRCPRVREDRDGFEDEDGCVDADNDADGILDPDDRCPTVAETRNGYLDEDGCPDDVEREIDEVAERVFFERNQARVRSAARTALSRVVAILRSHPEITRVRIEGHADARGSDELNRELSHRRALAVRDSLISQGIASERLEVLALGESRPEASGAEERAYAQNRRVQFTVIEIGGRPVRSE